MFAQLLITIFLLSMAVLFGWKFCLKPAFFSKPSIPDDKEELSEVAEVQAKLVELADKKARLEASAELVDVTKAVRAIEAEQADLDKKLEKLKKGKN